VYSDLYLSCVTLTFKVWTWVKVTLHIVSIRTFIPSYMVIHQCISKLKPRHDMLQTDGRTDKLTDEVYSYNPLQLQKG